MPEGPEIHRIADRLAEILAGEKVERVEFRFEHLHPFEMTITGSRVRSVEARGKALLTRFDCGLTMYSHNQLYGRWYITGPGQRPATSRSLRVALHTMRHSALLYSATDIEILRDDELSQHPFLVRIGPDILDDSIHWPDVAKRLKSPGFHRRSLASIYLDQSFMAGLGNYLRSEILHFSGLSPSVRPAALTRGECGNLARNTLSISRRSYDTGGLTNTPGRITRLRRQGLTRSEYRFAIFDREGLDCYACGDTILRIEVTSRRLYYCPTCQRE